MCCCRKELQRGQKVIARLRCAGVWAWAVMPARRARLTEDQARSLRELGLAARASAAFPSDNQRRRVGPPRTCPAPRRRSEGRNDPGAARVVEPPEEARQRIRVPHESGRADLY